MKAYHCIILCCGLIIGLIPCLHGQVPKGFNYQAIAKDASNNPITTPIDVRFTIREDSLSGDVFWVEEHTGIVPNSSGLFTTVVGRGTRISGLDRFADIDWAVTPKFLMTEINYGGWKLMGSSRIWSVPYAQVAGNIGGPLEKLVVEGSTSDMEEPLFEVKNKGGKTVFAVYNEGVRIYVDDGDFKGTKGGFAVSSFDDTKAGQQNYLYVGRDSIRAYVFDDPLNKAVKGGFAVSGFNEAKKQTNDFLLVSPDSVRIFIDKAPSDKGVKGGFAVSGFGLAKGADEEYFRVTRDSTRVYVNEEAKAPKGGFAVGGFSDSKTIVNNFLDLTPQNYFIGHQSGQSITTGLYNSFMGYQSGISNNSGSNNIFIGYKAGFYNDTGTGNLFIGNESGHENLYGGSNVFIGYQSGYSNTEGDYNTYIGYQSGYSGSKGSYNTFIGYGSGLQNIGQNNVFLGYQSGGNSPAGNDNVFLGNRAGYLNEAYYNVFVGNQSGSSTVSGPSNVFIGNQAGKGNVDGAYNIYIGRDAGLQSAHGSLNVFLGNFSGTSTTVGGENVFLGNETGRYASGDGNVFIGPRSGTSNVVTGDNNVFIGYSAGAQATGSSNIFLGEEAGRYSTGSNNIFIGRSAEATGSYKVAIGSLIYGDMTDAMNMKMRVHGSLTVGSWVDPVEKLDVAGGIKLGNTSGTNNGTIRWNGADFEGRKGGSWYSLTSGGYYLQPADLDPWYALYVDNTGRVGIGTTTPSEALHVWTSGTSLGHGMKLSDPYPTLTLDDQTFNADDYQLMVDANTLYFRHDADDDNTFESTRLTLSSAGYLGIGTTTPSAILDVAGTAKAGAFSTASGSFAVPDGGTATADVDFGGRSVYIVKASWGGSYHEGTRAWYVITQNDMNSNTGPPTIIDLGMSAGSYHKSSNLSLITIAGDYNSLRVQAVNDGAGVGSTCYWAITRVAFN